MNVEKFITSKEVCHQPFIKYSRNIEIRGYVKRRRNAVLYLWKESSEIFEA